MISADPTGAPVVTPPPRLNRVLVSLLGGGAVLCALGAAFGRSASPGRPPTGPGLLMAALFALVVLVLAVGIEAHHRQQQRSGTVVGHGAGRPVVLLPILTTRAYPLWFAVRPVEGGEPLGRIGLATTGAGFDPWAGFVAWGSLAVGAPIALTSADGHQQVLPITPLVRLDRRFRPSEAMTHVVGRVLGWPPAERPRGRPDLAPLDTALREWRSRLRIIGPATAVIPTGLSYVVLAHLGGVTSLARTVALGVVTVLACGAATRVCQAPIRAVVAESARARSVPLTAAARVVAQARSGALREQAPHGPAGTTDGSGWTPPPLPLPPR
jgi:hypothetical protein